MSFIFILIKCNSTVAFNMIDGAYDIWSKNLHNCYAIKLHFVSLTKYYPFPYLTNCIWIFFRLAIWLCFKSRFSSFWIAFIVFIEWHLLYKSLLRDNYLQCNISKCLGIHDIYLHGISWIFLIRKLFCRIWYFEPEVKKWILSLNPLVMIWSKW